MHLHLYQKPFIFWLLLLVLFGGCRQETTIDPNSGYFPEIGKHAIYQRALDLQNDIHVLSLTIEPGFEDLQALAYFRFGRGATIHSAYLTNGEGGASDLRGEYGNYRAATRRNEARAAIEVIGGETHFLNFPDIAAYRDRQAIEQVWPAEQLVDELTALINTTQPDVILIASDYRNPEQSAEQQVLLDALRTAISVAGDSANANRSAELGNGDAALWNVEKIYLRADGTAGLTVAVDEVHPHWEKSYRALALEAAQFYRSIRVQRKMWLADRQQSYKPAYSSTPNNRERLDAELPIPASPKLQNIEKIVTNLAAKALDGQRRKILDELVSVMDSVTFRLPKRTVMTARESRSLLAWKKGLDDLRNALLGLKVHYTVSDTALTERQLTYLNISQVDGIREEGQTTIFFGGLLDQGWAVNEANENDLPLVLNEPYRLVTPGNLEFNVPFATNGLSFQQLDREILFFIIHKVKNRAYSFIHRSEVKVDYVPRFEAEVLTPIVRMGQGARVLLRLQNHSRDGVADTVQIDHEFARAPGQPFRLSNKEDAQIITFFPIWNSRLDNGRYEIPFSIRGDEVARFTAIKFDAIADTTKRVGLMTGIENSPIERALPVLQLTANKITPDQNLAQQLDAIDVLILDKRVLTLLPEVTRQRELFDMFVEDGGHLVILAQDAKIWNTAPLMPGLNLQTTAHHYGELPVMIAAAHAFVAKPNELSASDWREWLFLRSHNVVSLDDEHDFEQPVRVEESGAPLIVTIKIGEGRKTYVDLALSPQLQHIHAGGFRLFGNIISE